jgi:hypothetical protein
MKGLIVARNEEANYAVLRWVLITQGKLFKKLSFETHTL